MTSLSQALAQQGPVNLAQPGTGTAGPNLAQDPQALAQLAQMLAGQVAGEVLPLVRAELGASLGPWLADTSANLKRLDTRLAVSTLGQCVRGMEVQWSHLTKGCPFSGVGVCICRVCGRAGGDVCLACST